MGVFLEKGGLASTAGPWLRGRLQGPRRVAKNSRGRVPRIDPFCRQRARHALPHIKALGVLPGQCSTGAGPCAAA